MYKSVLKIRLLYFVSPHLQGSSGLTCCKLTIEARWMSGKCIVSTKDDLRHTATWRKAKISFLAVLNHNVNMYVYIVTFTTDSCQVDNKKLSVCSKFITHAKTASFISQGMANLLVVKNARIFSQLYNVSNVLTFIYQVTDVCASELGNHWSVFR